MQGNSFFRRYDEAFEEIRRCKNLANFYFVKIFKNFYLTLIAYRLSNPSILNNEIVITDVIILSVLW